MNLVHKSEMGIKIKYKLISHLYRNHKVRGYDCIQKVAEIGMGLRKVNHFWKVSLLRQPPAWLIGSQVNTQIMVMEVLQKSCYKSKSRRGSK